jgi:RimJ/RimL family protein N-acetyltransferase
MFELEGEHVVLRPFRGDELERWMAGRTQLGREALPGGPGDRERLRMRVEGSGRFRNGEIDLAIEARGKLIGEIATYRPPGRSLPPRVYEMGVALWDPAHRGRGYGAEAVRLFADWLFRQGAEQVQGGTAVANHPMRRVFEKVGFTPLGDPDVEGVEEVLYGVTKSDWTNESVSGT